MTPLEREGFYVGQLVILLEDTTRIKAGSIVQITSDQKDLIPEVTLVVGTMLVDDGLNTGFAFTYTMMPLCMSNLES